MFGCTVAVVPPLRFPAPVKAEKLVAETAMLFPPAPTLSATMVTFPLAGELAVAVITGEVVVFALRTVVIVVASVEGLT